MNPRYLLPALVCASMLTLYACSNPSDDPVVVASSPTPDNPATRPARLERDFQGGSVVGTDEEGKMRTEARQAVLEFVKNNLQGWNVKGMSSQVYPGYVFSIDADLEKAGNILSLPSILASFSPSRVKRIGSRFRQAGID